MNNLKIKNINKIIIIILISTIIFFIIAIYYTNNNKTFFAFNHIKDDKIIIVDAGHGGEDGGAIGIDGTIEKDINLQISHKLIPILKLYGYKVIVTRNDDNSIHDENAKTIRQRKISDIHNREKIINENPNAIFVSIHQNKYDDPSVNGTQVFYSKNNPSSALLAQNVQDSFVNNIQKDNFRKIKQSGTEIYLLYHSQIPSIMVECGFISNYNELENLKNEKYQLKIAQTITDGIINYYKEQDELNGSER